MPQENACINEAEKLMMYPWQPQFVAEKRNERVPGAQEHFRQKISKEWIIRRILLPRLWIAILKFQHSSRTFAALHATSKLPFLQNSLPIGTAIFGKRSVPSALDHQRKSNTQTQLTRRETFTTITGVTAPCFLKNSEIHEQLERHNFWKQKIECNWNQNLETPMKSWEMFLLWPNYCHKRKDSSVILN